MKAPSFPTGFVLFLMILLIILSPQVQLAARFEIPDRIHREESPLFEYFNKYVEFQKNCPKVFQNYSIEQIFNLIEHLENDDQKVVQEFKEIKGLGEYIGYLAQEGLRASQEIDFRELKQDLSLLPSLKTFNLHISRSHSRPSFFPFSMEEELKSEFSKFGKKWTRFIPDSSFATGFRRPDWSHLIGFPKLRSIHAMEQLYELCGLTWQNSKQFIKKHKKEVIIGAIIVITIILIATIAISYSAAAAGKLASGVAGASAIPIEGKDNAKFY